MKSKCKWTKKGVGKGRGGGETKTARKKRERGQILSVNASRFRFISPCSRRESVNSESFVFARCGNFPRNQPAVVAPLFSRFRMIYVEINLRPRPLLETSSRSRAFMRNLRSLPRHRFSPVYSAAMLPMKEQRYRYVVC